MNEASDDKEKVVISKKRTGTSATYHEDMQSQRCESERKRLDGMHAIFRQVGLMPTRAKCFTRDEVEVEGGSIILH